MLLQWIKSGFPEREVKPEITDFSLRSLCNAMTGGFWKFSLALKGKGCLFWLRYEKSPSWNESEFVFCSHLPCFYWLWARVNKDRYVGRKRKDAFTEKGNSRRSILSHYAVNYCEQAAFVQGLRVCCCWKDLGLGARLHQTSFWCIFIHLGKVFPQKTHINNLVPFKVS